MKAFLINNSDDICKITNILQMLDLNHKWKVQITKVKPIRTISQNKLYWSWLNLIADELGDTKEYYHDHFREKYLGKYCGKLGDALFSTTTLDTKQFTDYLEKIRKFAHDELNIRLPLPDDKYFDEFYNVYEV
jgi:hypothetical protein